MRMSEPRMRMDDPGAGHLGGPPLRLDRDRELAAACLAQGGFPRAVTLAGGRTVWAGHDDKLWRFGGPRAQAKRRRPKKAKPS